MSVWFNARLIVNGPKASLQRFARAASRGASRAGNAEAWLARTARALGDGDGQKPTKTRPKIFTYDFKFGEGGDLRSERMRRVRRRYEKLYTFQMRNNDGRDYFREVSRFWPDLQFILVTACEDEIGSCLLSRGRSRDYMLPVARFVALLKKNGYTVDDEGSDEYLYWDSTWEAMDLAEAKWRKAFGTKSAR